MEWRIVKDTYLVVSLECFGGEGLELRVARVLFLRFERCNMNNILVGEMVSDLIFLAWVSARKPSMEIRTMYFFWSRRENTHIPNTEYGFAPVQ